MNRSPKIDRPIFILGTPRSGTTLLYNLISGHSDLAWFSNITSRLRAFPQLAYFSRYYKFRQLLRLPPYLSIFIPKPFEGVGIWETCRPADYQQPTPPLSELDLTEEEAKYAQRIVKAHLKFQGKPRFINKNIKMSRHAAYLNAIFPDAIFIHIIRDPRGTAASLLSWNHWQNIRVINNRYITPKEWVSTGNDPSELAALIWLQRNQNIIEVSRSLGNRYQRIYYEDLAKNPKDVLVKILQHCDLKWDSGFEKFVDSFDIRNMNYRYRDRLSSQQIATIERIAQPLVDTLDYDYTQKT